MENKTGVGISRVLLIMQGLLFLAAQFVLNYGNVLAGEPVWTILLNILLLSIPLGLLFFGVGLWSTARNQRRAHGRVDARLAKIIHYVPRVAGALLAGFVSLFALDVFDGPESGLTKALAFLLHASPAIGLAILVAVSWRRPRVGFIAFLIAASAFLGFLLSNPTQFGIVLLFSGPLLIIALLFREDWLIQQAG